MLKQLGLLVVRLIGLEPTRRETPDPKSGASTNFATSAILRCKGTECFPPDKIYCAIYFRVKDITTSNTLNRHYNV